jgi:hypothetical protein
MSRTHRFLPGRMPVELVHAIVLELGFELRCSGRHHRLLHPDDCASGQRRYPWSPRSGAISDGAFAAALRRRGWSDADFRAWHAPVCGCCLRHRDPAWERRLEGRTYRRGARVLVDLGREDEIRHPRRHRGCDWH